MIDIRQSVNYANYLKREGWIVETIAEINYFIKKFPVIGSILKIQRPEEIRIDTIRKLARKYRVFQIIIEPKHQMDAEFLASIGYKLSNSTFLPSKTLQIDLTQSRVDILGNFKKDARRAIREGSGLTTKTYATPEEIAKFQNAWKKSVKLNRYVPSLTKLIDLKKSFPHNHSLFLTSHNITGSIIGGALFTISSHGRSNYISYYWYGFTNSEGRTSLSQYSLLYQGILWAKKQGCKVFDFEGVFDPRFPNKSWLGFSHFKRSFGGYEVEYPGCFTKLQLPI